MTASVETRWNMSPWRMLGVGIVALTFSGVSLHQVVHHGEDWPLSAYQMYPTLEGRTATRNKLVGVTAQGEFPLSAAHIGSFRSRIRYLMSTYSGQPKRLRKMLITVQREYAERKRQGLHDGPPLQGLRMYSEKWRVQQGLAGIDTPRRQLKQAVYVAPAELAARWALESSPAGAPALPPEPVPDPDLVLSAQHAELAGSARVEDGAVVLEGSKRLSFEDSLSASSLRFEFEVAEGRYAIWVRVKTAAGEKGDSFWLSLDDVQLLPKAKDGFGNFRDVVPANAYVWVNSTLAAPASLVALKAGRHQLTLSRREGPLTVDQVWLSQKQLEAPAFNARVTK